MNKTREIVVVPKRSDGFVKTKPMGDTVDKASPSPGISRKAIPKKHPPRTASSGAAAVVDRKPSKSSCHGRVEKKTSPMPSNERKMSKFSGNGRLERGTSEDSSNIEVVKTRKKHSPSDTKCSKATPDDSETFRPRKRPPSREASMESTSGNAEGGKPPRKSPPSREPSMESTASETSKILKKHPPSREHSLESSSEENKVLKKHPPGSQHGKDCIATRDIERKPPTNGPRLSVERRPLRQNSSDKIRCRSTERNPSLPPSGDRGRAKSVERKPSERAPSTDRNRARSIEGKPSTKAPMRDRSRARSVERKPSACGSSKEKYRARSKERKPSMEAATKDKLRTQSTEPKLVRQNSKDNIRPRSNERKPSQERTRPGFTECKAPRRTAMKDRPKSEELLPYNPPIKELTRKRSKSADRVPQRETVGNGLPGKCKGITPPEQHPMEIVQGGSNPNGEKQIKKTKSKEPEIIELSKESNSSNEETVDTVDNSASGNNSSRSNRISSKSCNKGAQGNTAPGEGLSRQVSFGNVEVNEFPYSMGCDVVSRDGPPLGIAYYRPLSSKRYDVEAFENARSISRRNREELLLSELDRIIILQRSGYTAEDIEQACWEAEKVRKQRYKSIKNKDWDGWNAASESLARKISKISNAKELLFGSS